MSGIFYVASQLEGFPKSLENSSRENPKQPDPYFGLKKLMVFYVSVLEVSVREGQSWGLGAARIKWGSPVVCAV